MVINQFKDFLGVEKSYTSDVHKMFDPNHIIAFFDETPD
jgi:hypothetical protein